MTDYNEWKLAQHSASKACYAGKRYGEGGDYDPVWQTFAEVYETVHFDGEGCLVVKYDECVDDPGNDGRLDEMIGVEYYFFPNFGFAKGAIEEMLGIADDENLREF